MAAIKIVGVGHMGGAIARALCANAEHDVTLIDTDESRLEAFQMAGVRYGTRLPDLAESDVVVLAIPPQCFGEFAAHSRTLHGHRGLLLSVMAGLSVAHLSSMLLTDQVVRSIPNTPSEIGLGMTVYFAHPNLTQSNLRMCRSSLSAIGEVLQVDREDKLDPATALCGGGPAFVAYFLDAMTGYGIQAGFSDSEAMQMALQVLRGTGELVHKSGKAPMRICREVMTPQGTTERGIQRLQSVRLADLLKNAFQACADRSRDLNSIPN